MTVHRWGSIGQFVLQSYVDPLWQERYIIAYIAVAHGRMVSNESCGFICGSRQSWRIYL